MKLKHIITAGILVTGACLSVASMAQNVNRIGIGGVPISPGMGYLVAHTAHSNNPYTANLFGQPVPVFLAQKRGNYIGGVNTVFPGGRLFAEPVRVPTGGMVNNPVVNPGFGSGLFAHNRGFNLNTPVGFNPGFGGRLLGQLIPNCPDGFIPFFDRTSGVYACIPNIGTPGGGFPGSGLLGQESLSSCPIHGLGACEMDINRCHTCGRNCVNDNGGVILPPPFPGGGGLLGQFNKPIGIEGPCDSFGPGFFYITGVGCVPGFPGGGLLGQALSCPEHGMRFCNELTGLCTLCDASCTNIPLPPLPGSGGIRF